MRQAEQDLVWFLGCRAQELVPGGQLLLASPGDTDQARVSDGICDVLNDACLDLVAAGRLQPEQYERLTMPVYFPRLLSCSRPWNEKTPPYAACLPCSAPRRWRFRRPLASSSSAMVTWRPTPGPTLASSGRSPSRWCGRPLTNRRAIPRSWRVCMGAFEPACSPS